MNLSDILSGVVLYSIGGLFIGAFCMIALYPLDEELPPEGKALYVLWPLAIPVAILTLLFKWKTPTLPWSQEVRIKRRIARAKRERHLIALRAEAEHQEAQTRIAFERYVSRPID